MATQVLFNQLAYIDHLEKAGFTKVQARASAEALELAFHDAVATKTDISTLKAELSLIRSEIKTDIEKSKNDTVRWVIGLNLVVIGTILTFMFKFIH